MRADPTVILAWLATYALHSTILLSAAWLLTRVAPRLTERWTDVVWKTALVGGVITSLFHTAGLIHPVSGSVTFAGFERWLTASVGAAAGPAGQATAEALGSARGSAVKPSVAGLLIALWSAGAAIGILRLIVLGMKHRRGLGLRSVVSVGRLPGFVAGLCRRVGVRRRIRVTIADLAEIPMALGRNEICVPQRVLDGLDERHQRMLLAHELAHLVRGDPAWFLAAGAIEAVFFFQPLNRVGRRAQQRAAESECDRWAVRHAGEALDLAECLARVAGWLSPSSHPLPSTALVGPSLVERVELLLDERRVATRSLPRTAAATFAAGALLMVCAAVPRLATGSAVPPGESRSALAADTPAQTEPESGTKVPPLTAAPPPHRYTVNATDPAGVFTLDFEGSRVVGATIDGVSVSPDRLMQTSTTLVIRGGDGPEDFLLQLKPDGGISWEARRPRARAPTVST